MTIVFCNEGHNIKNRKLNLLIEHSVNFTVSCYVKDENQKLISTCKIHYKSQNLDFFIHPSKTDSGKMRLKG